MNATGNFNWADYLALARSLAQFPDLGVNDETILRCAISRAYYAAFCHARNYARDRHGLALRYNGEDHFLVKKHFTTRRAQGVALKLDQLRLMRNQCDYADAMTDLTKLLPRALAEAEMVIAILK